MTIRMDYDQLAADYARNRRVNPEVLKALLSTPPVTQQTAVLEVGCGTGNYIIGLGANTGCMAWGLEPSAGMLAHALTRGSDVRFVSGCAEAIGLAADTFDLVFSVDVIHHVQDRPAYFHEAYRVLKPGGWLCTVTDSEAIVRKRQPLSTYFPETVEPELRRYPRMADLNTAMEGAGFQNLREQAVEFSYLLADLQIYR
ncbi:MAG: methyltransferase domain-containing protein, partial [Anaerolineae bacterium]|nr:methyltransferase domain-containing protein [Anaerolineae bacterium]